jgi:hypothetical protein
MIGTRPERLNFSPALSCVDCKRDINQGLIYQMGSLVWQLLPLCDEHIEELSDSDEPISLSTLRYRINEQVAMIQHLQRGRRHLAYAYLHLRRQHTHHKAQHALRVALNRSYRWQAQMREEGLL